MTRRQLSRRPAHGHAVVIGASMAGLLAARVLADHFSSVTIVERDTLSTEPGSRPGTPQTRHVHVLLVSGYRALSVLFPGFDREIAAAGAPRLDWRAEFPWLGMGGWAPRCPSDLVTYACSRDLLENTVRARLLTLRNVYLLDGRQVVGLQHDERSSRVTGITLGVHDGAPGTEKAMPADLVVDAAGRFSRAPAWLEALGYSAPEETVINPRLGYATRWYRRPDLPLDWKAILISAVAPDQSRAGTIFPAEGDRWAVTLFGTGGDYPPIDEAGFLDFARTLRTPILYEAIQDAEPLSPIYGYRRTENLLRHYDRQPRFPEGYVVMGDAACAFNPIYGQGMTVAAQSALALDQMLTRHGHDLVGFSRRFQTALAGIIHTPWLMATGEDLRWPSTEGQPGAVSPATRLVQRYLDEVLIACARSEAVVDVFGHVVHLLASPMALFSPRVMLPVARHAIARRLGMGGPAAPPPIMLPRETPEEMAVQS